MLDTRILCDVCLNPLPTEAVEDSVYGAVEVLKLSRTKEWDTRLLFPHLCENCALKIDNALLKFKNEVALEGLINQRNKKLNAERKERLGTKG